MEWLLWALTGITMEFGSDETFSHWAATRDDAGFIAIIGAMLVILYHLIAQRAGCWGATKC